MGRPWGIFFGFYKTRHILLSDSANCTVLRAVVLTQYRRAQTDRQRQTHGNAIASTALASCNASIAARCNKTFAAFENLFCYKTLLGISQIQEAHTQPFYGPFATTRVSRCQKKIFFWTLWSKGDIRGRHTNQSG